MFIYSDYNTCNLIAPVFLNPLREPNVLFLLWIVGNVDKPESIVSPVTPIEIGLASLVVVSPYNLPQVSLPKQVVIPVFEFKYWPVDAKPTWFVVLSILHLTLATLSPATVIECTL